MANATPDPAAQKDASLLSPSTAPEVLQGIAECSNATTPLLHCGKIPTFLQEVDP